MLDYMQPHQGLRTLGIAIVAVVVINALFAFAQEYKAERASMALRRLMPDRAVVMRHGTTRVVEARDIAPADLIIIREGDRVPADARLVEPLPVTVSQVLDWTPSELVL